MSNDANLVVEGVAWLVRFVCFVKLFMFLDFSIVLEKNFVMTSLLSPEELNMVLARAKALDKAFTNQESPLEVWARKFGADIWANKKKQDDGEFTNGMYFPNSKHLRDPQEVKVWANALHQDVTNAIQAEPDISSQELCQIMQEAHFKMNKYYPFIYRTIAANPMKPTFYVDMLNDMFNAQIKIREGGNVDHIEAELEARFLHYKTKQAAK